jgi:hypothetical protein
MIVFKNQFLELIMLLIRFIKKKSIIIVGLVSMFLLGNLTSASGSAILEKITAYLDHGIKINLEGKDFIPQDTKGNPVAPINYNGSTYLPLRALSQVVGLDVNWDGDTKTVYLSHLVSQDQQSADGVIQSEDHSIQYTLPKGWTNWTNGKTINPQTLLSAWSQNKFLLTIQDSKASMNDNLSLKDYSDIIIKQTSSSLNNAIILASRDIKIDGKDAMQFELSGEVSSYKVVYMITIINAEKYFYDIFEWTGQGEFDAAKGDFKTIASSFKEVSN